MKIKVSETTDIQLDWLVAKALGLNVYIPAYADSPWLMARSGTFDYRCTDFSTDWSDGGPIIEREGIQLHVEEDKTEWMACRWGWQRQAYGPTPLIAAMRCYVASKLGDEVEIPDELV